MTIYDSLILKLKQAALQTVVFPEGDDDRVREAAEKLAAEKILTPLLLSQHKLAGVKTIDPESRAAKKQMTLKLAALLNKRVKEAQQLLKSDTYFATMLVKMGEADGMVSGAVHSTADTVRPALTLIKTAAGMKRVSGAFVMERQGERYIFADCAMNIDPDSETLAEIAYQSAQTAKMVNIEPRIAFLSFSTKGSAQSKSVDKVVQACRLFKEKHPDILADGELQFDAAYVPEVGQRKAPASPVAGKANVFIFPEIQSGNIAYKVTQRLGGFSAVGPILQGMAKPVNDLSRGASSTDIYQAGIVTAAQSLMEKKNE